MEVLPIPGRAASRIRSELFRPEMARSRSRSPVDSPGMARSLEDQGGQLPRRLRHPAQQGLVLDDLDVLPHIGGGGSGVHKLEHVAPGLVLVVVAVLLHALQHRHRVDGEGVVEHGVDSLVDFSVLADVEVVGAQLVDDLGDTPGVDEHGT